MRGEALFILKEMSTTRIVIRRILDSVSTDGLQLADEIEYYTTPSCSTKAVIIIRIINFNDTQ